MSGKISWKLLLRNWGIVFLGNLAGAVVLAALMAFFGQLNIGGGDLAVYTAKVAAAKNGLPWMNAFVLGIFCNLMVCVAVYLANTAQDTAGKLLAILPHHGIRAGGSSTASPTCTTCPRASSPI